jgi:hypothetical protein
MSNKGDDVQVTVCPEKPTHVITDEKTDHQDRAASPEYGHVQVTKM